MPYRCPPLLLISFLLCTTCILAAQASSGSSSSSSSKPAPPPGPPTATDREMACPIDEDVALSSRRCAGARFLFEEVVQDPLAAILAGADIIESERASKATNAVYPVVAIRTHWMDNKITKALTVDPELTQVVLCGAGMDARGHRLKELRQCHIFELDVKPVLDYKSRILASVTDRFPLLARGMHRLITDFSDDVAWVNTLKSAGFDPRKKTIWILEGFLYYFEASRAQTLLRAIQAESAPGSILLADHINDFTLTSLREQASNKWLISTFSSAMEVPETAVADLGFEGVEVVTVGEEGANFGLWGLPVVPRKEKKDFMRTYLFQARVGGKGEMDKNRD